MALIDDVMPAWDERARYARPLDARPEDVMRAVRELRARELPVTSALMGLRAIPNLLARQPGVELLRGKVLDGMLEFGFVLLGESEREIALGAVGRFWRPVSTLRAVDGIDGFRAFSEPGHARAVMDFRAVPMNGGSVLTTETRIAATDDRSRRLFRRYWRLISLGSGLIRHEMLGALARRAEAR